MFLLSFLVLLHALQKMFSHPGFTSRSPHINALPVLYCTGLSWRCFFQCFLSVDFLCDFLSHFRWPKWFQGLPKWGPKWVKSHPKWGSEFWSEKGTEKVWFWGPSDAPDWGSRVGGSTIFIKSAGCKKCPKSHPKMTPKSMKILRKFALKHVGKND